MAMPKSRRISFTKVLHQQHNTHGALHVFVFRPRWQRMDVKIRAHEQVRVRCSHSQRAGQGYDHLRTQVPLWNIRCHYYYAPRRVECPKHGIVVEHLPWSPGEATLENGHDGHSGDVGPANE